MIDIPSDVKDIIDDMRFEGKCFCCNNYTSVKKVEYSVMTYSVVDGSCYDRAIIKKKYL